MGDNYCHVWEIDDGKIYDDSLECSIFSFDVHASFTYPTRDEEDEDEVDQLRYLNSLETETLHRTHELRLDQIERDPRSAIHDILDSMQVPVEDFMIEQISACVIRMLSKHDPHRNRKVYRVRVNVDVVVAQSPFDEDDDDDDEDDDNPNRIPASKETIEGLEEVEVENPVDCAICLDGFSAGSKAKRMPCSHLFHHNCIVNWLGRSKLCPTCRFEVA